MTLTARQLSGKEGRVPDPVPGEAAVTYRYGKERAIVIHPADFHRLTELEQLLSTAAALDRVEFSDEAIRAHRATNRLTRRHSPLDLSDRQSDS